MNSHSHPSAESGFTILEVIIALAIMAFISIGIFQAKVSTFRMRESLANEGDFYSAIRLGVDIIQRDIALIYNPTLVLPPKKSSGDPSAPGAPKEFSDRENSVFGDAGVLRESEYFGPAADRTGIRPVRFQGSEAKMSFISTSNLRIYRDSMESELAKVLYELGVDPLEKNAATKILYKTTSPNVYEDDERKDTKIVRLPLLKGVRGFSLEYYQREKKAWSKTWDSESPDLKGKFPDEIKIRLEIDGPTPDLKFSGEYIYRPEVPLSGLDPSS